MSANTIAAGGGSPEKTKRKFTRELLDEVLQRDGATLVGEYENVSRDTIIEYICSCGSSHTKNFRRIEKTRAICKDCGTKHMIEALKTTSMLKYGTTNPMKSSKIQQKMKNTISCRSQEDQDLINEKRKTTNQEKYGGIAPSCSSEIKEKAKQTNLQKYGTLYPNQNEQIKKRNGESNLLKYGVKSTAQLKEVKEKAKETCLKKYGVVSTALDPDIKSKQEETLMKNYGVINPFKSLAIQSKAKETNVQRYGVEHPNQDPDILAKAQKPSWKDFTMPSGDIRKVQGYEPFALRDLLKTYSEDQIKTDRVKGGVPRINYETNGKMRYYFPDIFIPHENKIIEVKSTWTYECKTDNIHAKKTATESQGFVYEIWCYNGKGERVELPTKQN